MTDPMRAFAWLLIVAGVAVAIGWSAYVANDHSTYNEREFSLALRSLSYGGGGGVSLERMEYAPGLLVGAGLAILGVLLLAIRQPASGTSRADRLSDLERRIDARAQEIAPRPLDSSDA